MRLGVLTSHPIQYYAPWFRHLASQHDVRVFYCHRQDSRAQAEAGFGVEFDWDVPLLSGYEYQWLTNVARRPGLRSFWGCDTPEIREIIASGGFDAFLFIGWNRKSAVQGIRACWREGVPALMRGDSQLQTPRSPAKTALKYFPYRWFLPRLDAHLYVGRRNRAYLWHYGVADERLFFSPHFVDNEFFARRAASARSTGQATALRRALRIPGHAFVAILVGKLIERKRPLDFVEVLARARRRPGGKDVYGIVVGDGPLRGLVEAKAHSAAVADRLRFAGFCNQSSMPRVYAAADVIVLCSDARETWGLVVNEGMASGLPAIVSEAAGCASDMIDPGITGFTCPVGAVAMFARRLIDLRHLLERDRATVCAALAEKTPKYSMERATEGLQAALEAVSSRW